MLGKLPPSAVAIGVFAVVVTEYLFQTEMTAAIALMGGTLCLNVLGYVFFDVLLFPYYYQWVAHEQGGKLTVGQIKDGSPPARMALNFCVEICGHLGILLYTGSHFDLTMSNSSNSLLLSSYAHAMTTAILLDVVIVIPRFHHMLWENRAWKLITAVEVYQLARRIVAVWAILFFSRLANETLPGTIVFRPTLFDFPWVPLIIMTVVRFVLSYLWYGPFFIQYWIKALQEYKRDDRFPSNANINMLLLILLGVICGLFQNILLMQLQAQLGAIENVEVAVRCGFYLWFFYLLPSVSTDLWEGKPITLPMIEYSLHLVEICLLFAVNAIYQNS